MGFGGLLAAVFVAMIAAKVVRFPLRDIERAMQNIVRRKYGYRLRTNKNSEFHEVYEDVNKALERLEQLDSTQRAAMRIRNALQSDMKTLTKFLDIMAHEIKNPLHSFGINLDVLKTKIDKDLPKADYMKHVKILEQEAEHLQEIIEGFLTYARPVVPRRERSKINMLVKNVCQMAAAEAKTRNIKLETRLARSLPDVMIDRKQIQQALHNIVINAVHASNDGGKISIRSWIGYILCG